MPNTKSAKKRLRQSLERRTRNRAVKSAVKTQVRKASETAASAGGEQAQTEFRLAIKKLDQAILLLIRNHTADSRNPQQLIRRNRRIAPRQHHLRCRILSLNTADLISRVTRRLSRHRAGVDHHLISNGRVLDDLMPGGKELTAECLHLALVQPAADAVQ